MSVQSWNVTRTTNGTCAKKASSLVSVHENPFTYFPKFASVNSSYSQLHIRDDDQFYADLAAGSLANVVWVKPDQTDGFGVTDNNPTIGQAKLQSYMNAIYASSLWQQNRMLVVVTFSDGDGLYDHVDPYPGDFFGPGERVPTIIVSPSHAGGKINSQPYETGSILKMIETRWGITDTLFSPVRWQSTGDLTNSFTDQTVFWNATLDAAIAPTLAYTAPPATALIEHSYAACVVNNHQATPSPFMMMVGGERSQSSTGLVADVWVTYNGWATAQPKGQAVGSPLADGSGPTMFRRAASAAILSNGNVLYWGGKNGTAPAYTNWVLYSTDQGTSWATATLAAPWIARSDMAYCAMPNTNIVLLAGGVGNVGLRSGVYFNDVWMSSDGIGANWTQVNTGFGFPYHGGSCVAFYDSSAVSSAYTQRYSTVFLISGYATNNYRSFDGGVSWEALPIPWTQPVVGTGGTDYGEITVLNSRIFMALAVDLDNVLYAAGAGLHQYQADIWVSSDKGANWYVMSVANSPSDPWVADYIDTTCVAVQYPTSGQKQLVLFGGTIGVGPYNPALPLASPIDLPPLNTIATALNPSNYVYLLYANISAPLTTAQGSGYNASSPLYRPNRVPTAAATVPPAVPQLSRTTAGSSVSSSSWPSRVDASYAADLSGGRVFMAGGNDSSTAGGYTDVFVAQLQSTSSAAVSHNSPSGVTARVGGSLVYTSSGSLFWIGGQSAGAIVSSVLVSANAGQTFTTVTSTPALSAKYDASACSFGNAVYYIGGANTSGATGETWTVADVTVANFGWTQQSSVGLPAFSASGPCVATSASTVLVAIPTGAVYQTTTSGASWTFYGSLPWAGWSSRSYFAFFRDQDGWLYTGGGGTVGGNAITGVQDGNVAYSRDGRNWYVMLQANAVSGSGSVITNIIGSGLAVLGSTAGNNKTLVIYGGSILLSDGSTSSLQTANVQSVLTSATSSTGRPATAASSSTAASTPAAPSSSSGSTPVTPASSSGTTLVPPSSTAAVSPAASTAGAAAPPSSSSSSGLSGGDIAGIVIGSVVGLLLLLLLCAWLVLGVGKRGEPTSKAGDSESSRVNGNSRAEPSRSNATADHVELQPVQHIQPVQQMHMQV